MAKPVWPNQAKAAVTLTMDNLGEPLEIQLGLWPKDGLFGTHPSIKESLPKVLDILDQHHIKATYFIESWSLTIYPDAAQDIKRRGHEIGWHSYQHEFWDKLNPKQEEENFNKSLKAAHEAGITYAGFRPPSGKPSDTTYHLLRQHGFRYISPVGEDLTVKEGLVQLPFKWKEVDAFYYVPEFGGLRKSLGQTEAVVEPDAVRSHLLARIQETVKDNGHLVILFHPALLDSEEKRGVLKDIAERISNDPDIWCAPCEPVADWIKDHPQNLAH
jgi:peptidoglycan/xylan/chitin deacetylase (PgdA/CDA1 family)